MNGINLYSYRYLYVAIVFFSSIYVMVNSFATGFILGDFYGFELANKRLYFICFVVFFLLLFYYDIVFNYLSKLFKSGGQLEIRNETGWCVLFIQVAYVVLNFVYDMNRAGDVITTDNPLKYIFLIINADYVFLLYYCFVYSQEISTSNIVKLNLIVFILSTVSRGWFGFFPLLFILIICKRIYLKRSIGDFIFLILISSLLVALLPYLYTLRSFIRTGELIGGVDLLNMINNSDDNSFYFWLNSFIARFDSVPSLYYFFEKLWPVDSHSVQPLYMQGIFFSNIYKLFGFDGEPIARLIVKDWFGSFHSNYQDRNTAFTSTIIPYLSIDGLQTILIYIYFHFYVFISAWISSFYNENKSVFFLTWYMGCTLFLSGWAGAYLSYLISQILFMCFFVVKKHTS